MLAGAALTACAALAFRPGRVATWMLATGAVAAALAVPLSAAMHVAQGRRSDAGLANPLPPARALALSRFLVAHQRGARYEVASSTVIKVSPLIVRDGRPVLMLTSYQGRPLLTVRQLAAKVRAGEVRYVMLGPGTCTRGSSAPCPPVLRWAWEHASAIRNASGLGPRSTLARLSVQRVR